MRFTRTMITTLAGAAFLAGAVDVGADCFLQLVRPIAQLKVVNQLSAKRTEVSHWRSSVVVELAGRGRGASGCKPPAT